MHVMISDKQWRIFSDLLKLIPDAKRRLTAADGDEYLLRLASAVSVAPIAPLISFDLTKNFLSVDRRRPFGWPLGRH